MTAGEKRIWTQVLVADFAARMAERPRDSVSQTGEEFQRRLIGYKHDSWLGAINAAGRAIVELRALVPEMGGDNDYAVFYREAMS
jgi:hypothetical protein